MKSLSRAALFPLILGTMAWPAAADLAEVRQRGTLRVLFPEQETPFFRSGESGPQGFDLEVLKGFARVQGIELEPVTVPFSALLPTLLEGGGDVIAGGYAVTADRKADVRYTTAVTPQRHVILTRAPAAAIEDPAKLRGLRVGVAPASSWRDAALAVGVAEDKLVETLGVDPPLVTQAFKNRTIDAAVTGLVFSLIMADADPEIRIGAFVDGSGSHAYAVRPGDAELLKALDGYLDAMRDGPAWYRLVLEHFGPRAPDLFRRARSGS